MRFVEFKSISIAWEDIRKFKAMRDTPSDDAVSATGIYLKGEDYPIMIRQNYLIVAKKIKEVEIQHRIEEMKIFKSLRGIK